MEGPGRESNWFQEKLELPWSAERLASSLNADRIRAATNAWSTIETAVQARILLAVASMRKSAVSSCAEELEELFRTAQGSGVDDWGCIMGQMFRTFAVDGRLSADIDSDTHHNLISQLSASLDENGPPSFRPLETLFLNPSAATLAAAHVEHSADGSGGARSAGLSSSGNFNVDMAALDALTRPPTSGKGSASAKGAGGGAGGQGSKRPIGAMDGAGSGPAKRPTLAGPSSKSGIGGAAGSLGSAPAGSTLGRGRGLGLGGGRLGGGGLGGLGGARRPGQGSGGSVAIMDVNEMLDLQRKQSKDVEDKAKAKEDERQRKASEKESIVNAKKADRELRQKRKDEDKRFREEEKIRKQNEQERTKAELLVRQMAKVDQLQGTLAKAQQANATVGLAAPPPVNQPSTDFRAAMAAALKSIPTAGALMNGGQGAGGMHAGGSAAAAAATAAAVAAVGAAVSAAAAAPAAPGGSDILQSLPSLAGGLPAGGLGFGGVGGAGPLSLLVPSSSVAADGAGGVKSPTVPPGAFIGLFSSLMGSQRPSPNVPGALGASAGNSAAAAFPGLFASQLGSAPPAVPPAAAPPAPAGVFGVPAAAAPAVSFLSNLSANLSAVAPVPPKIEAQPPIAGGATAAAAAAAPAPAPAPAKPPLEQQINTSIGASTNSLSQADRQLITVYLSGNKENPDPSVGVKDIILNEERNVDEKSGRPVVERLVFQIDYNAGTWRKLRRKALLK